MHSSPRLQRQAVRRPLLSPLSLVLIEGQLFCDIKSEQDLLTNQPPIAEKGSLLSSPSCQMRRSGRAVRRQVLGLIPFVTT